MGTWHQLSPTGTAMTLVTYPEGAGFGETSPVRGYRKKKYWMVMGKQSPSQSYSEITL